eukprot:TRINITY_DN3199_c0_g1_i1.p1 TRINITY_DN3199_c0_g1~~TRINITY_DN3199_c0_g1_i1.p1  ORF type:complete len:269 (-),score=60.60 TRINITY_DN3199_c0_g1_i1:79-885(-)
MVEVIKEKYDRDISKDKVALKKLLNEAEKARWELSEKDRTSIHVEGILDDGVVEETLTRSKFEELNADLFAKVLKAIELALLDSEIAKNKIDEIILVGGSSRIPKVQQLLKDLFNGKESLRQISPEDVVTHGAAILGDSLCAEHVENEIKKDKDSLSQEEIQKFKDEVDARERLESEIYSLRNLVEDPERFGGKIGQENKEKISAIIRTVEEWLDENPNAEKSDLDQQLENFKRTYEPILIKVYQMSGSYQHSTKSPVGDDESLRADL